MKPLALIASLLAVHWAAGLDIGDKAPPLKDITWVKGDAPDFAKQLTLVEFWATWCGPCRRSAPHLSKLAQTYRGKLEIAGLSDEKEDTIKPFVQKQGENMDYNVDMVPPDLKAAYMTGVSGIPHAFLVDTTGTVIWKGHPMRADAILEQATSGTVDITRLQHLAKMEAELDKATRTRDLSAIARSADALLEVDPLHQKARYLRMLVAKQQNDREGFLRLFSELDVDQLSADKAAEFANTLVSEPDLTFRNPELAVRFAKLAITQKPDDANALATYARTLYALGHIQLAIEWQQKALDAAQTPDSRQKHTLEYYQTVKRLQAKNE